MYFVYILKSSTDGRHYIGMTRELDKRLIAHNAGRNISTKTGRPWAIAYSEQFDTKAGAFKRERQIKRFKGGRAFKELLS